MRRIGTDIVRLQGLTLLPPLMPDAHLPSDRAADSIAPGDVKGMKLSDNQKRDFEKHLLVATDGSFSCPICGKSEWTLNETLSELRSFNFGRLSLGAPLIPLVVATCKSCGFLAQFNAVQLGLIGEKEEQDA